MSSPKAAEKRADKLRAKGKTADFDELLKIKPDGGVTNVRITTRKHRKQWLGIESHCVVPFTTFSEFQQAARRRRVVRFR